MSRLAAVAALPALGLALITGGGASSSAPSGLSPYGRLVWNLDAALHDSFGTRRVYLAYHRQWRGPWNFQTTATADCCGGHWLFTFADARDSAFRLLRPAVPPREAPGAAGGEVPLTIRGRYIGCSNRRWLYIHYGNGPANTKLSCSVAARYP
jgi:hypothetical protein